MKHPLLASLAAALILSATASAQNTGIGTTAPTDQLHTTGTVRFEGYRGPGTRTVQIDSAGRLLISSAGPVFSAAPAAAIPDNACGAGTGATSSIVVSGLSAAVPSARIAVRVNITHTYLTDLRILLVSPAGEILVLTNGNGSTGQNFTNTVFTDEGYTTLPTTFAGAPFTGKYKPTAGLSPLCLITPTESSFADIGGGSIVPNGTWTLKVFDGLLNDVGTLDSWAITFSGAESFTTAAQNNYIPRYNAGGGQDASVIYQNAAGNIGIGTTTPAAKLQVAGGITATGTVSAVSVLASGSVVAGSVTANGTVSAATLAMSGGTPAAGEVLTATNAAGAATWSALPSANTGFKVLASAPLSIAPGTSGTIPFSSLSGAGCFDDGSNLNTTTYAFVVPATGVYHLTAVVGLANTAASNTNYVYITFSGTSTSNMPLVTYNTVAGQTVPGTLAVSSVLKLTGGESISVRVYNNTSANILTSNGSGCQFTGVRIY